MGITTWRLREQSAVAENYFSYQLNDHTGKPVGLLLADAIEDNTISLSEQENLAKKIMTALTPHFTSLVSDNNESYLFAILLGSGAKKIFFDSEKKIDRVIFHDALIQLVQNAERKKELWSQIKPLRDLFNL